MVTLIGIQPLGLFGEFIDRDLAHNEREILCLVVGRLRTLSSYHGVSAYLKLAIHGIHLCLILFDDFLLVLVTILTRLFVWLDLLKKVVVVLQ